MDVISLLLLLAVANGVPVVIALLLKERFNWPLDGGIRLSDGQRLLGSSKTVRGIATAIVSTALIGLLLNLSLVVGALVGFWAMVGDLCSSFIKRRYGLTSSSSMPGLDHILEALFPLCFLCSQVDIKWLDLAITVFAFTLLALILRYLLHRVYPRIRPR